MILCQDGRMKAAIAADFSAHPIFETAAKELGVYLSKITGDKPEIIDAAGKTANCEIVLAWANRKLRADMPDCDGLKNDGFRIVVLKERVFLIAENSRGILFAVYRFLEEFLGCGFYSSKVEKIPARSDIDIPEADKTIISPFEFRENWWFEYEYDPAFAKKRGMNSSNTSDLETGGFEALKYNGFAHTMFDYVSPEEYYDEHPEYFSLVDGKRMDHGQLCLTNSEVKVLFKQRLRQRILENPDKKIVSITQMDGRNYCTCPECSRIDEEEGSHAGTLLRFVNECALSIKDEFPDILIDTFAYVYTRKAPKITKPVENVCVRLCTIESCFKHSFKDCGIALNNRPNEVSERIVKDFDDWAKICNRIFVWDYSTIFKYYIAPYPNFQVLKENIQFLIDHHATGLFNQGNAESISGEFGELRGYIISRLMWEPDLDVDAAMDEFLQGYYGNAAANVRKFLDLLQEKVLASEGHFGLDTKPEKYIPEDFNDWADPIWDEAEKNAENAEVLQRVRKSRLCVRFMRIRKMRFDDPNRDKMLTDFKVDCMYHGLRALRETAYLRNAPERYVEAWRAVPKEDYDKFDSYHGE